eukprot:gnl/TRDRNA2_/TRDRNA2_176283_c1_seq1.p1 gnl/TRDRNA2_/TRDRNA2_176283_c1~~gnl/TRDRNA2_/TRDRNA2_176283_c1_seq1.p1  ORF type:complete len:111 (-),score=4.77 gnl/TRDRNA2_/TRDRNA2_176283_c1_seq1:126-458(-)
MIANIVCSLDLKYKRQSQIETDRLADRVGANFAKDYGKMKTLKNEHTQESCDKSNYRQQPMRLRWEVAKSTHNLPKPHVRCCQQFWKTVMKPWHQCHCCHQVTHEAPSQF